MGARLSMPNWPVIFYFWMDENLPGNQMNSFLWTIWQVTLIIIIIIFPQDGFFELIFKCKNERLIFYWNIKSQKKYSKLKHEKLFLGGIFLFANFGV
jgi:hypothetical protein